VKLARALGTALLALAAVAAALAASSAVAQAPKPTHVVRKGDTLFGIARKAKYEGATRDQMIVAIYRANQAVFPDGNINRLEVGTVLKVPPREVVFSVTPAEADRIVHELLAALAPRVAPAPAQAPHVAHPRAPAGPPLSAAMAAKRYQEGLALEKQGKDEAALQAFLEAGQSGYGPAQVKLGEVYDKGNSFVQHDYAQALRWYQKAREQGMEIPKPFVRSPR
jgi:FimV-like protein